MLQGVTTVYNSCYMLLSIVHTSPIAYLPWTSSQQHLTWTSSQSQWPTVLLVAAWPMYRPVLVALAARWIKCWKDFWEGNGIPLIACLIFVIIPILVIFWSFIDCLFMISLFLSHHSMLLATSSWEILGMKRSFCSAIFVVEGFKVKQGVAMHPASSMVWLKVFQRSGKFMKKIIKDYWINAWIYPPGNKHPYIMHSFFLKWHARNLDTLYVTLVKLDLD